MLRRDLGFESDNAGGTGCGSIEAGEREHPLNESAVLAEHVGELLIAVVRLVREAEAALFEKDEVALRVAGVVIDEELEESARAAALKAAERAQKGRDRVDSSSVGQLRCNGGCAQFIGARFIEEAGVEVANLALFGAGLRRLRFDNDVANSLFSFFSKHHERSIAGFVGRDFGAVDPCAVHMTIKVVLRAHLRVEIVDGNSG